MLEQLGEDEQELKVWQQKKKAKDATWIRGIVRENDKKGIHLLQDEMENSCTTTRRHCSAFGVGLTPKVDGLTLSCVSRPDVRSWSTFVTTRCTRECPERRACVRWVETDKGQPREAQSAREVARAGI